MNRKNLWIGLNEPARNALAVRDYKTGSFAQRLPGSGVEASELTRVNRAQSDVKRIWIPGVEIFARKIFAQLHRGSFGEFVRENDGVPAKIGFWPKQWSGARMFVGKAFTFIRQAFLRTQHRKNGTADCSFDSGKNIHCVATTTSNGT